MSEVTLGNAGLAAAENKEWDIAIVKLSAAIEKSPNPNWLNHRSKAYVAKCEYAKALADAERAWHAAFERNRRELIVEANRRRAVAYYRLKQYANADCCYMYVRLLIDGGKVLERTDPAKEFTDDKGLWTISLEDAKNEMVRERQRDSREDVSSDQRIELATAWRSAGSMRFQAISAMVRLPEDDNGRKCTTSQKPDPVVESTKEASKSTPIPVEEASTPALVGKSQDVVTSGQGSNRRLEDEPVRMQDFQTNTKMSVSILIKGLDKDTFRVEFGSDSVELGPVVHSDGEQGKLTLSLWDEIVPDQSGYTVTPHKVELSLAKKVAKNWRTLSRSADDIAPSAIRTQEEEKARESSQPTSVLSHADLKTHASGPSYPTSSASGPKNWDKIADDENSDDDGNVDSFFKKIFKGGNPDTQRAMMKSFTESNGTSLSTDWDDVKGRTVETRPPDGQEAKKYER